MLTNLFGRYARKKPFPSFRPWSFPDAIGIVSGTGCCGQTKQTKTNQKVGLALEWKWLQRKASTVIPIIKYGGGYVRPGSIVCLHGIIVSR